MLAGQHLVTKEARNSGLIHTKQNEHGVDFNLPPFVVQDIETTMVLGTVKVLRCKNLLQSGETEITVVRCTQWC